MRKLGYVLAVGCIVCCASSSFAGLAPVGDPYDTESWGQKFREAGVGAFDTMIIQIVAGGPFPVPAFKNFNKAGWTSHGDLQLAWAVGPDQTDMTFDIQFEGLKSTPLAFNFWALNDGVTLEGTHAGWTGNKWNFTTLSGSAPAVPEPLTMASAFFAIAGLGGYIRRRTGRAAA